MDTMMRGRVWPDGTFVLWRENPAARSDPDEAVPFGLSEVVNSHRHDPVFSDKLQRGIAGITSYGQRMVENAAYLLQQKYGGRKLSFLTCTIPGTKEETLAVADEWCQIVRIFLQWLKRELLRHGLSPAIASVTEIQPKRQARDGGMPLHLHMVFQGAHRDYKWCISPERFRWAWRRAVLARVPSMESHTFASAMNVQHVRQSAKNYLGKYMSKGSDDITDLLDRDPELVYYLPSTWYNLTKEARDAVKTHMVEGEKVGLTLETWLGWQDGLDCPFTFARRISLKDEDGYEMKYFYIGTVAAHWKKRLGVHTSKYDINSL